MHQVLLVTVMATSQPHGILFHREHHPVQQFAQNHPRLVHPVQTVAQAVVGTAKHFAENHPRLSHPVETVVDAVRSPVCKSVTVTRTVVRGCPNGQCPGGICPSGACPSGNCPGGVCPVDPNAYQKMPNPPEAGPVLDLLEKEMVRRNLRKVLSDKKKCNDKTGCVGFVLGKGNDNHKAFEMTVDKVYSDLKAAQKEKTGNVGKLGDGKILQMIIDALPQILAFIQEIVKLFHP